MKHLLSIPNELEHTSDKNVLTKKKNCDKNFAKITLGVKIA